MGKTRSRKNRPTPNQFKVPPVGLVGGLGDQVGGIVEAVVCGRVIQTRLALPAADRRWWEGLWPPILSVCASSTAPPIQKSLTDLLYGTETVLPLPGEADVVLRVDGKRDGFGELSSPCRVLGGKRPHLATGQCPSAIQHSLCPRLRRRRGIAIALLSFEVVPAERKIRLDIPAQRCRRQLAHSQQRNRD